MNQDLNNYNNNNVKDNNQTLNNNINQNQVYKQKNNDEQHSFQSQQVTGEYIQNNNINNNHKKGNIGLILGIVGGVLVAIICAILTINMFPNKSNSKVNYKTNTFYADGYDLKYGSGWVKSYTLDTNGDEIDALMYGNKEAYLIPIGNSALSEFEDQYNCDFKTNSGKKKIYDEFYSFWNSEDMRIYSGSNGFSLLTDNTYYATMNYGVKSNKINGKMYLIINTDNNIVISLMSNISSDFNKNSDRILDILKTINIQKKYDNELSDTLDSMSAWNQYSYLRQGTLGVKKDINGGWRTLSNSETYWVFKNGEFWWYKSINDLNDNYWYGKTRILTGKSGLKEVGLDEEKVDYIVANANGKVSANNIYTIIFTPLQIISGGIDKSSTNITGDTWHMVWIIVDHGTEGLEAQMLNVKTAEMSYLVKLSDY